MMLQNLETYGFTPHELESDVFFYVGRLPEHLVLNDAQFDELWDLHPQEYHDIKMHGKLVKTPRWQQAYGADYHYTGNTNTALPTPPLVESFLDWAHDHIEKQLNGALLNWYDGSLGHYIGPHHDSTTHMVVGAPIVTISFGEERTFRLRPGKRTNEQTRKTPAEGVGEGKGYLDFPAPHGCVFVTPYETNLLWKHEVPKLARYTGKRISVTLRAFVSGVLNSSSLEKE